jgi:uncharacterized membrane protein
LNLVEFKESGLLELYALNTCSLDEKLLVEEYFVLYPELLIELNEVNLALESYVELHTQKAPEGLDAKIKKQLVFKPNANSAAILPIAPIPTSKIRLLLYLLAASILAILGLSIVLNSTQNKLNNTQEQLAILTQEKILLAERVNRASFELADLNQNLRKIESDVFIRIKLSGTEKYPTALMKVFWNKQSKETFISLINAPSLPKGKQFQLWALVNGKPINAGVFDSLQSALILSSIATTRADLFAVTIENTGGSESPTLSEMVVAGNVIGS